MLLLYANHYYFELESSFNRENAGQFSQKRKKKRKIILICSVSCYKKHFDLQESFYQTEGEVCSTQEKKPKTNTFETNFSFSIKY